MASKAKKKPTVKKAIKVEPMGGGAAANAPAPARVANGDQESWVMSRLRTAIRMAAAAQRERRTGADTLLLDNAIEGIVNGAAVEIIRHLGMEPSFTNIRGNARRIDTPNGTWILSWDKVPAE